MLEAGVAVDLKILYANRWTVASPIAKNGRSEVEIFMDEVETNFKANMIGLAVMMERHSKMGPESFSDAQCHYVHQNEKIYEYVRGRLRLFWFEDGDKIVVCTHGIVKKTQKTPVRDVKRAIRVKEEYLASKAAKRLIFVKEE